MNTSLQAAGGRAYAPADPNYPWRVTMWEERGGRWILSEVFEERTFELAEEQGLNYCTEPYPLGVTAMHYVVGEVA